MAGLHGHRDSHLRLIEPAFSDSEIIVRGNEISILGESAGLLSRLFEELVLLLRRGEIVDDTVVKRCISMVRADEKPSSVLTDEILRGAKGRTIRPKTAGQKRYIDAIRNNVITFGVGPAGTGKSWLAVAMAVHALQTKSVQRIILTRPAVEAGERLGFLPGDLMAKIDPYLRPLYDAMFDMVDAEGVQKMHERQALEVAPLAFMRRLVQSCSQIFGLLSCLISVHGPCFETGKSGGSIESSHPRWSMIFVLISLFLYPLSLFLAPLFCSQAPHKY
jgi:phosphate starvation-inducible PhoH-like protein